MYRGWRWWNSHIVSWCSLGNISPHGYYVFSLMDKPDIKLSSHGLYVVSLVDKLGIHNIRTFKLNLTMKININQSNTNRDLNQSVLHLWSYFGDPELNGLQVIAWTGSWLTHGYTCLLLILMLWHRRAIFESKWDKYIHMDRQTQVTITPEGQN